MPDLALVAVVCPAMLVCSLCQHRRANANLSVLQLLLQLDSWTQLFLSLSPQALPAPLSRSAGHGRGVLSSLSPAACQLSAAQDEPLPLPLRKRAALTEHTVFPGAAVFCGFSSACYSLLLVADSRWLRGGLRPKMKGP